MDERDPRPTATPQDAVLPWTLALIAATLAGGALPVFANRSSLALHRLVALATGLFLGIVFVHVLPEILAASAAEDGLGRVPTAAVMLAAVVGLRLLRTSVLPGGGASDPHVRVRWGFFVGLSIHAIATGMSLAEGTPHAADGHAHAHEAPAWSTTLLLALLPHKAAEGFSLGSVLLLSGAERRRIWLLLLTFALATPFGLAAGTGLHDALGPTGQALFSALAAGTFLFIAFVDLVPELFHGEPDRGWRVALLVLGLAAAPWFH